MLASVFDELLRYAPAVMGQRTAAQRVALGGHHNGHAELDQEADTDGHPQRHISGRCELRPGTKVLMPYRQMHLDAAVFGGAADRFDAPRFLHSSALARSTSYRLFSATAAQCPGRFLARREICLYVALVLHRFNSSLADAAAPFPRFDDKKVTGGMFMPVDGDDVVMLVKPCSTSAAPL
jgi:cytochrome P450